MGSWSAESANGNYSRRVDRERQEAAAKRQAKAATAAGRAKRKV
jgi:hypothetical protein